MQLVLVSLSLLLFAFVFKLCSSWAEWFLSAAGRSHFVRTACFSKQTSRTTETKSARVLSLARHCSKGDIKITLEVRRGVQTYRACKVDHEDECHKQNGA